MHNVIERILNLLAFLLTADRPVTAEEIRRTVNGYDRATDEAWRRMFERDKDLLRGLGIPLELRPTDAWEVEHGYVVPANEYALPDPGLTDEERAALWLAAQVVRIGGRPAGADALFKLGGAPLTVSGEPLAADLGRQDDELAAVFAAVAERRELAFRYRDRDRVVWPYGLVHRRGHWYIVGPERRTVHIKVFRLDRSESLSVGEASNSFERPEDFSAASAIPEAPWEAGGEDVQATVRFDAEMAWWAGRQLGGRAEVTALPDGGIEAVLSVANPDAFVGWVLGFDDHAVIVAPAELRERLLERVTAA
ncbi:MAG TPA: WYL domain-containing protein [Acidimicrobiia bacterium]|jgi:predicted DNA-binding transcriptional regulator YafY|nr:WYL domain-containing protein [Acidimicrobiia bacterium]